MQYFRMTAFGSYVADDLGGAVKQRDYKDATDLVTHSLRADGFDASEDGTGRGTPIVAFEPGVASRDGGHTYEECSGTIRSEPGDNRMSVMTQMSVRRLTPKECERLQGFPDNYTNIRYHGKPAADGPRYRAIGNSMAVTVMAWLGKRIQMVEEIIKR